MQPQADTAVGERWAPGSLRVITKRRFVGGSPTAKTRLSCLLQRLARCREDQEAWALLYRQLRPLLLATHYRLLGPARDLVEDAIQQVFLQLFRYSKFENLTDPDSFHAYLAAVCRNVANQLLFDHWHLRGPGDAPPSLEISKERFSEAQPDHQMEARELLQNVLGQLSDRDRLIFELLIEGCDLNQIAQRTGLRYFTAGACLCRLRARLAKTLSPRAKKTRRGRFIIRHPKLQESA